MRIKYEFNLKLMTYFPDITFQLSKAIEQQITRNPDKNKKGNTVKHRILENKKLQVSLH